jgi:hypothetical protein
LKFSLLWPTLIWYCRSATAYDPSLKMSLFLVMDHISVCGQKFDHFQQWFFLNALYYSEQARV